MSIVNIFQLPEQPPKAAIYDREPFTFLGELADVIKSHGMRIEAVQVVSIQDRLKVTIDVVGEVMIYIFDKGSIAFINDNSHLVYYTESELTEMGYTLNPKDVINFYEGFQ